MLSNLNYGILCNISLTAKYLIFSGEQKPSFRYRASSMPCRSIGLIALTALPHFVRTSAYRKSANVAQNGFCVGRSPKKRRNSERLFCA
ncbi:MAG: hypothetical protein K6C94_01215 [Candidatus Gastranaerophilales bacterium]|nr:hypothetical protein [Candidatus Gastranaerophilales bacterium]